MGQTANLGLTTIDNAKLIGSLPDNWEQLVNAFNAGVVALDTLFATGASYARRKAIVSNTILSASAVDVTTASGDMLIEQIILETDATGLVGGTNFQLLNNNVNGVTGVFLANAISGLGANVNITGTAAGVTPMKPFLLEAGRKIQVQNTAAPGTGVGVVTLVIFGRRLGPASALS